MKVIVAGGREYIPSEEDREWLTEKLTVLDCTEVVSGMARGADTFGEEVAASMNLPIKRFPANWKRYGVGAGPIRNKQMAQYADAVILFPGNRGTASMRKIAREHDLKIIERYQV